MKHIIANPHNGAPIDAHGVKLAPGFEVEVSGPTADALAKSFEFLHRRTEDGKPSKAPSNEKPKKLKKNLSWTHDVPPDTDPGPHAVVHGTSAKVPKRKKAPKKEGLMAKVVKKGRKALGM